MFEKFAEQFEQDVLARYQQKLAVLGGGVPGKGYETLRNAFRTMKSISDKYIPFEINTGKIKGRRQLEAMMGYHNTNPWSGDDRPSPFPQREYPASAGTVP